MYLSQADDWTLNIERVAKKLAKRLEKEAKLAMKSVKAQASGGGANTLSGEKKPRAEKKEAAPFVNTTPKGQKKGTDGA